MKFGLRYCNTGRFIDPILATELLQAAEEAGFESAWTVEHTVVPDGYKSAYPYSTDGKMSGDRYDFPLPDPLIWMAFLAARTQRMKLGTGILILPQHNPVIVAKQVATLDAMSNGRVLLGIGVGWMREEFDVIGSSFDDRAARTDEYVAVMRSLWLEDRPVFNGDYVRFDGAYCRPQPVDGSVPIIIGGHSKAAARRAGRIGDGFFPAREFPSELIELAQRTAIENNRDPKDVEITVSYPAEAKEVEHLRRQSVGRVLVPVNPMPGMATCIRTPEEALSWKGQIEDFYDE